MPPAVISTADAADLLLKVDRALSMAAMGGTLEQVTNERQKDIVSAPSPFTGTR